ncbi:MAG TPA: hypothetical protein VGK36_08835 [Candidatus Angelobacter sp.]|jgi:hypothetical protein
MPTAASDTIGSLVIDLRANVAQLQADMSDVKDIVTKSSAQMSSQMKQDMQEVRGTLALMRDDIGISIPREMRNMIASSEIARTAILALGDAFAGLAFLHLGIEAFSKLKDYFESAQNASAADAKNTMDIANAAQNAVDATIKRQEALALIGRGEDERHAIQQKYYQEELQQNKARLASLQAQIAAKTAAMVLDRAAALDPQGQAMTGQPIDNDPENLANAELQRAQDLQKFVLSLKPMIDAANKAIDDATAGAKANALQYHDYLKDLALDGLKNEEEVALAEVERRKKAAQDEYQAGKIGLDAYIYALKGSTEAAYDIRVQELDSTLEILQKDPSRNIKLIEQIYTQRKVLDIKYEQDRTDNLATAVEQRKKITDDYNKATAEAFKTMGEANKNAVLPKDLSTSFLSSVSPKLDGSLAAFMSAQSDRFNGSTMKDAAEQSKMLEQAMEALLTPTQKYQVLQAEIIPLMDKYKDYPDAVKALTSELLKANPEFQKLQAASSEFGKDLASEIDNIAVSGKSLHDALLTILQDLEKIVLEATLLKPLENFFSGGSSGTSGIPGFLASLFGLGGGGGGAAAGAAGSSAGGGISGILAGFADGGDPPVGMPSIVGEDGPEIFVPQSAGTIIPNNALGGTTYQFNIDARGASPGTAPAIQRAVQEALKQNVRQSVAASIDYQRRR